MFLLTANLTLQRTTTDVSGHRTSVNNGTSRRTNTQTTSKMVVAAYQQIISSLVMAFSNVF